MAMSANAVRNAVQCFMRVPRARDIPRCRLLSKSPNRVEKARDAGELSAANRVETATSVYEWLLNRKCFASGPRFDKNVECVNITHRRGCLC